MKKTRVLKIMNDWATSPERKKANSYGGIGYYRTLKVAQFLEPEYEVTVWNREWDDQCKRFGGNMEMLISHIFLNYDIIWFHYTDNPQTFCWLRVGADKYKKKLVLDIDDNVFEVDKTNPARKKLNLDKMDTSNKKAMAGAIMSLCDAITVSTLPLKKVIEQHFEDVHDITKPIFVIPNYNDIADWPFKPVEKKDIIIGYIGGLSHKGDFAMVLPAIKEIMKKYPEVGFQVIGQMDLREAKKVFGTWDQSIRRRIILMNATATQPEYTKYLSEQPWSIGICPLTQTNFNECKSSIKFFEYSMYKIPVVASTVHPYNRDVLGKDVIIDGVTGLLATENQWVEKLTQLIEDEQLRNTLAENAYNHIVKNWQYKDNKDYILSVVKKIEEIGH